MSESKKQELLSEYRAGQSMDALRMRHKDVPYREIRDLILQSGEMRPKHPSVALPDEEEIRKGMELLSSRWSEQEAMTRWVGRSVAPAAMERGASFCRALRCRTLAE
jgi:hypothetical protein